MKKLFITLEDEDSKISDIITKELELFCLKNNLKLEEKYYYDNGEERY